MNVVEGNSGLCTWIIVQGDCKRPATGILPVNVSVSAICGSVIPTGRLLQTVRLIKKTCLPALLQIRCILCV